MIFKSSVTTQETPCIHYKGEVIAVCCETRMKHTNVRKVQILSILEHVIYIDIIML
jgi:hypothetical protein